MRRVILPVHCVLGFAMIALSTPVLANSVSEYSSGNYAKVPAEVKKEMAAGFEESQQFLARHRLATNSFAQDLRVSLQELLSVYDAGTAQAKKFLYDERMVTERAEVADWLAREQKLGAAEALAAVNDTVKWPEESVAELTKKSSRLFSLGILARRRILSEKVDPEWYFVAGKALDADTGSGDAFLELYLEQPNAKDLPHRAEALPMIEKVYQRRYDGALPPEIRTKLKRWKSAAPRPTKKSPSSR